jgi:hypothetical protein
MPDRLDVIFSRSHTLDQTTLEALEPTDLEELRSMALGRRDSPSRIRAMDALVASAFPEAPEVLGEVLGAPSEDVSLRAAAAAQLGRLAPPEAEDILLNNLPTATDLVLRVRIAEALAKAGSVHSIDMLQELAREDPEATVRRQASFSSSIIAYRSGLSGYEIPVPSATEVLELDPDNSLAFTIGPASVEETRATLSSLGTDTYGLTLSDEVGYRIECGPTRMFLTLAADFVRRRRNVRGVGMKRYMLPGLIAQRSPVNGDMSVRMLLFSWPADDDHFHLAVHRTGGNQLLYGSGVTDGDAAEFELNSIRGRGNMAVLLRGRLQRSAVFFTDALSSPTIVEQAVPQEFQPPS